MEQQQRIEQGLNTIDLIFQHVTASSILACLLIGWGLMLTLRWPIHKKVADDEWATFWTRVACIVGGMLGTALTWPVRDWRPLLAWTLGFGLFCPASWAIVTFLLGKFAPAFSEKLSMKRFTLDPKEENEANVQPAEPSANTPQG